MNKTKEIIERFKKRFVAFSPSTEEVYPEIESFLLQSLTEAEKAGYEEGKKERDIQTEAIRETETTGDILWIKCRFCASHFEGELGKNYKIRPYGILIGECRNCFSELSETLQQAVEVMEGLKIRKGSYNNADLEEAHNQAITECINKVKLL